MKEESSGIAVALTFSFDTFSFAARQKKSIKTKLIYKLKIK
jgi:hypothetical protein